MEQVNGFLRLAVSGGYAYAKLYAPKMGGDPLSVKEAEHYLQEVRLRPADIKKFRQFISEGEEGTFAVGPCPYPSVAGTIDLYVSPDHMKVHGRFFPPSVGGASLTDSDIVNALKQEHIKFGIDNERIRDFLAHPVYCEDVLLAEGQEVLNGQDASIHYEFNTNVSLRPKLNEDGSVNFHELDMVNQIEKGDLLAVLTPAKQGTPGYNVLGVKKAPRPAKMKRLEFGRNITLSEDKTRIYSDVSGHVRLVKGKVFVSEVYTVPADVDNSTGDVDFNGNVHVKGSVRSGFSIRCDGDIEVDGVVEAASLSAGGNIIVKHGIHGQGKGSLSAGGNVICKFVEAGRITAGGYVEAGSLINCQVDCDGDVNVEERKGFIAGGRIRSGGSVKAQTIGSDIGINTTVEIGPDKEMRKRHKELSQEIASAKKTIEDLTPEVGKLKQAISQGKKLDSKYTAYFKKNLDRIEEAKKTIEADEAELDTLSEKMEATTHARVIGEKDIYPGVKIVLGTLSLTVRKKHSHAYFTDVDGEIQPQLL